jgi:chromosome segregation ATPase
MARGITETDVWKAADVLLLEGARPTIERVRQKLGRGSPNTVSPYLETWFRSLGARIKDPGAFAASPALPDPISQAAAHFWEVAMATARAQHAAALAEKQTALEEEGARLAASADSLLQREERLALRERDMEEGVKLARAQLASTESRLQAAEEQLGQRSTQLEEALHQRTLAQTHATTQTQEIERLRASHAQELSQAQERHAAHERRWMVELDGERSGIKRLQARLEQSQQEAEKRSAALQDALASTQGEMRLTERGALEQRAELASLHAKLVAAEAAAVASQRREGELSGQILSVGGQLSQALEQLRGKGLRIEELTAGLLAEKSKKTVKRARSNAP